jgi:predicted dehydrogenase
MNNPSNVSRRDFVKAAGVGAAALSATSLLTSCASSSNEGKSTAKPMAAMSPAAPWTGDGPLRVGFIGIGKMGDNHLNQFVGYKDVVVTDVADVDTTRREAARQKVDDKYAEFERKGVQPCKSHKHYRELLADKSIQAVLIAVPDHWHTAVAMDAVRAGKDVYCEKPLTLTIGEAKTIIDCVRKHDRVFQTGSQQRSIGPFADAVDRIRGGQLGKIKEVLVGLGGITSKPAQLPPEQPDPGLDWNEWLGQAPKMPYHHILCQKGLPDKYPFNPGWRDYREFSGGYITDWGAHHFDITQWALAMDNAGPSEVRPAKQGTYMYGVELVYRGSPVGDEIVVRHQETVFEHEVKDKEGKTSRKEEKNGICFVGEKGKLFVNRQDLITDPVEIGKTPLSESEKKVHRTASPKGVMAHHQNWFECIKSRQRPIADVEIGARSVTVCHLVNLAYWHDTKLQWDPKKWEFTGDNAEWANTLRTRPRRKGYELPEM